MFNKKIFYTLIVAWIVSGVLAYGIMLGDLAYEFPPANQHYGMASASFIIGPIGLIAAVLTSNYVEHGVCFETVLDRYRKRDTEPHRRVGDATAGNPG